MWVCDGDLAQTISTDNEMVMGSDFGGGSSGALWTVETKIGWRALGGQVGRPVTSRIVLGWGSKLTAYYAGRGLKQAE